MAKPKAANIMVGIRVTKEEESLIDATFAKVPRLTYRWKGDFLRDALMTGVRNIGLVCKGSELASKKL